MSTIKIAFWNLQNLFDTTASPLATDIGFTPENGWTVEVFEQKLNNLAEVIKLMHGGAKPDLLGLCEIENKPLAEQLAQAAGLGECMIAHSDSPDIRGIDTTLSKHAWRRFDGRLRESCVVARMLPPQAESIPDVQTTAASGIRPKAGESRLPEHRRSALFEADPPRRMSPPLALNFM